MEKIIAYLRWEQATYSLEWVTRLRHDVKRHLSPPFRFDNFTDELVGTKAGFGEVLAISDKILLLCKTTNYS